MARAKPEAAAPPALARLFSDQPAAECEPLGLDFEGLAITLAELAVNGDNQTPFTVVVRGGWGRGKTTLLRRSQHLLEHPEELALSSELRRVETLWFNAWKYPNEDTVLAGLLGALLDKFQTSDKKLEQLKKLVASYKGALMRHVLWVATPAPIRDLVFPEQLENRFSPIEEKRAFHDTFRRLFSEVSRLLFDGTLALRDAGGMAESALWSPEEQGRETLAIFLDDLDRCRQERVAEVLEAINLFVDLPGVCFYLGLDWQRLVNALPENVRGHEQGTQFLEKIFQVALDLPAVSPAGAEEFITSLVAGSPLEGVLGQDLQVVAAALESKHPRHIKRFLNDLTMTLAVMRNSGKLGTGPEQVPEAAVLVWHLLPEWMPADNWRELRALTANARGFLRRVQEAEAKGKAGEELPEEAKRWVSRGLEARHFQALAQLSDEQLHVLVHLASPAKTEVRRAAQVVEASLFDLTSAGWVHLPGGKFEMGSNSGGGNEKPPHRVTLSPFALSRFPVTNAEYAAYVRETGKQPPEHWLEGAIPEGLARHPVVRVSWSDAEAYCTWLSRKLEAAGEKGAVLLPTEAQWEFAARGEAGREYPWGAEAPDAERANFGDSARGTTPVDAYPKGATPKGVHDLAGNVFEWCRDWFGPYPAESQIDPPGPAQGTSRVLRGGSFLVVSRFLRGAFRFSDLPDGRASGIGFRVVWSVSAGLVRA